MIGTRRVRRRVLAVTAMLLVASAVNLAVAWGCALWSPDHRSAVTGVWESHSLAPGSPRLMPISAAEARLFRFDRVPQDWVEIEAFMGVSPEVSATAQRGVGFREISIDYHLNPFLQGRRQYTITVVECGWPLACFDSRYFARGILQVWNPSVQGQSNHPLRHEPQGWRCGFEAPKWLGARQIRASRFGTPVGVAVLPYRPMLLGLMVNTLAYAAVMVAPWAAWKAGVRTLRARSGRCIGCGYDVKDLPVCPECGRERVGGKLASQ